MQKNEYDLDLKRHQRNTRRFPWSLLRKIIMVGVIVALLIYLNMQLNQKEVSKELPNEIEVDIAD